MNKASLKCTDDVRESSGCARYLAGNANTLWTGFLITVQSLKEQCVTFNLLLVETKTLRNQRHISFLFKANRGGAGVGPHDVRR